MSTCEKDWVDIFSAIGPMITGFIALWIAYRQHTLDADSKRKEYADRYYEVYKHISKAMDIITQEGTVTAEGREFIWQTRDLARLYLSSEVAKYVQKLFDKTNDVYRKIDKQPNSQEYQQWCTEEGNLYLELIRENPHEIFRKYMADK